MAEASARVRRRGPRERVALFLAALAVVTIGREVLGTRFELSRARQDDAYAGLARVLPRDVDLGYASDIRPADAGGGELYMSAQYALAPHVLAQEPVGRWIVAHVTSPEKLAPLCARLDLRAVYTSPDGTVALLERAPR